MSFARDFDRNLRRTGRPVTAIIVGALAVAFVLAWLSKSPFFVENLGFLTWAKPWTALTYPFAASGDGSAFISVLFECWWLWQIGGEVESAVGSGRYPFFFSAATLLGAVGITIGHLLVPGQMVPLLSPLLPIGAVTVAWATRNPNACVRLWAVIPIAAKWLGWIYAGVILFSIGNGAPLLGVCALLPLAGAWAFADNRIPGLAFSAALAEKRSRAAKAKASVFENEVKSRKIEREERERLRKLFEGSLEDK